ncbi:MAG: hypothetical protein Q7V05_08885 [Methanoregula sp.]|nr:hypothetical protein [Methanoregula sp.]
MTQITLLKDLERYEDALSIVNSILTREPENWFLLSEKIEILEFLMRYEDALSIVDNRLRTDPENWNLLSKKIEILKFFARYEDALSVLNYVLSLNPVNSDKLFKESCLLKKSHDRSSLHDTNCRNPNCNRIIKPIDIIQCGPCGNFFCKYCWEEHRGSHGKIPSVGIGYNTDGSFYGYD